MGLLGFLFSIIDFFSNIGIVIGGFNDWLAFLGSLFGGTA